MALINLVGTMTKYGSSLSPNAGTVSLRRAVRGAATDRKVKAILRRIDSPAGAALGEDDLADDVRIASEMTPFTAFIEDMGASAA